MTIEEKRQELIKNYGNTFANENSIKCIEFYYSFLARGDGIWTADAYASLNTLFGYDIGIDNAKYIRNALWSEGVDVYNLDADEESKQCVKEAASAAGVDVDFSNWRTEPYEFYSYF